MKYLVIFLLLPLIADGQNISLFAGGGSSINDGGLAINALIYDPAGMIFDKSGNLLIASGLANRIRKIDTSGTIYTIAGTGAAGYSGDSGLAVNAKINFSTGIAVDSANNIFFTDKQNYVVRKIDASTGKITTICGNGIQGYTGDNGPASAAQLYSPENLSLDKYGNIYIAENSKHVVRKISSSGNITTIAGTGTQGYNGDAILATNAQLNYPEDIAVDDSGNIYISDQGNYRIRKINTSGIISTYAGNGNASYIGDEMIATDAQFAPTYIKLDSFHNLYVTGDNRVYKIDNSNIFHRVSGDGVATNTGDGGPALDASLYSPVGIALDRCNNLYISLVNANKIRKIAFNPSCKPLATESVHPQSINICPNPSHDIINIDGIKTEENYALFNVLGIIEQLALA